MSGMRWVTLVATVAALGLSFGCESNSNDSGGGGGGGGGGTGLYAGTWTGHVCGRGIVFDFVKNGTALSGTWVISDPTFPGTLSGTVSSLTPPATAHLICGSGRETWWYDLTFNSANQLTGGFFKPENGGEACDISATK